LSKTCLVFHDFTPSQLNSLCCSDGRHTHIDDAELREYRDLRLIDTTETANGPKINWIREPKPQQRSRGVVRMVRQLSIRGKSSKIGTEHALALAGKDSFGESDISRRGWALAMLGNIRVPLPSMHKTHLKHATNGIHGTAPGAVSIYDHPDISEPYERSESLS
jgi:hypothetical protein